MSTIFKTNRNREYVGSYTPTSAKQFLTLGETYKAPPVTTENEVAILDVDKDEWLVLPDHRGESYYTSNGSKVTITQPGEVFPSGAITVAPETKYHNRWDNESKRWIFDYAKCREDLYAQIEDEKRKAQGNGILINGVLWDSDQMAEIRLTQLWLIFIEMPTFETTDFYANSDTPILMNKAVHTGWRMANTHHLQNIFGWRTEAREAVKETTNTTQLMRYFDTLKFIPTEYNADGSPQEG